MKHSHNSSGRWIVGGTLAMIGVAWLARSTAAATYDESISGDLPNNAGSPQPFTLALGTNSIIGSIGGDSGTDSIDAIAITVPAGMALTAFKHSAYTSSVLQEFIGFQVGSTFSGPIATSSSYAGLAHFGAAAVNAGVGSPPGTPTSTVGLDLLPVMNTEGLSVGASGFSSPLGPGTYTFLIGQITASLEQFPTYQFDVTVITPEPGAVALLAIPALLNRRRRSSSLR